MGLTVPSVAMDPGYRWREAVFRWMGEQGWRKPSDVVNASGTKPNGRPRIDASRMNAWLKGEVPKDPEMLRTAAKTFNVDLDDVLIEAGYRDGSPATARQPLDVRTMLARDDALSDEARRLLLAAYDAAVAAPQRQLRVARKRTPQ